MANVVLSGKAYWAKTGWKNDTYSGELNEVKLKVDEEYKDKAISKQPMLKNKFKFDEKSNQVGGGWFFHAQCKRVKANGDENELPVYVDVNGEEWDDNVLIGNGSDVKVAVEVYQAKKAPHPTVILREVKVEKLEEFNPDKTDEVDWDDDLI